MGLTTGAQLGSYDIVAPLGAGGMGEVYRARDTALGRFVAVKILPETVADDPERLARFEREARALAALNHPHVAQIYGFEEAVVAGARVRALVMELVEGEDLAERISRGRLHISEALAIAKQIAEALEVAHAHGIIHRDLKPANIRLRGDGGVKLLDFGLAKAAATDGDAPAAMLENSPTISSPAATARGVILGTAAYMAPEQASGKLVDKRVDVWAFGVVLYEMLAGRRPFQGDDVTSVMAQVLEREPDWSVLPPDTPDNIRRLLRRCLEKDRRRRLRDCGDARLELDETDSAVRPVEKSWLRLVAAGAVGAAVGAGAIWGVDAPGEPATPSPGSRRFALVDASQRLSGGGSLPVAVSRDGRRFVYAGPQHLMVRAADDLAPRPIPGTEPVASPTGPRGNSGLAVQPILSPDGESVAFFQAGELRRVPVAGGTPAVICQCGTIGATWADDDTILLGGRATDADGGGVWSVPAGGGEPTRLVPVEAGHLVMRPQRLPGGDHILFTIARGEHWDEADVVAYSFRTGRRQVLVEGGVDGRYLSSGHLVYGKDGVLLAVKLDPRTLAMSGVPVPVLAGVAQQTSAGQWGGFAYDVSDEGTLVYWPAPAAALRRVLVWVDRDGRQEPLPAEPRAYQYPRISPNGERLALDLRDQQNDVWVWDLVRATLTRATVGRHAGGPAIWDATGTSILFGPDVEGAINLHSQPTSGGQPRRLMTVPNMQFADDVTPDGKWVIFSESDPKTRFDVRRQRIDGSGDPESLVHSQFTEQNADVSPDGRWLAYQSDESGRFEVYVRPFPNVNDGRWQVSSNGGSRPLWSRNGSALFYLDADRRMTVVAVQRTPALGFGRPAMLFETTALGLEGQQRNFDVSADGKRFLMVRNLPPPGDVPTLVVIEHWLDEVRARVR
jgi:serine/threonine-protein kinase